MSDYSCYGSVMVWVSVLLFPFFLLIGHVVILFFWLMIYDFCISLLSWKMVFVFVSCLVSLLFCLVIISLFSLALLLVCVCPDCPDVSHLCLISLPGVCCSASVFKPSFLFSLCCIHIICLECALSVFVFTLFWLIPFGVGTQPVFVLQMIACKPEYLS